MFFPALNVFLHRLGRNAGAITPPLVQPFPESVLMDGVTQFEHEDQSCFCHTAI